MLWINYNVRTNLMTAGVFRWRARSLFNPVNSWGICKALVESGTYNNQSGVIREGLRLLQERTAGSNCRALRKLIDEAGQWRTIDWKADEFLQRMKQQQG